MNQKGSRMKGQEGEREFCKVLEKLFSFDGKITRNLEQTRQGGADITMFPMLSIEVKRQESLDVSNWWKQAVTQSKEMENKIPVLAFRQNRRKWRVLMPLTIFIPEVGESDYFEVDLEGFKTISLFLTKKKV